jgi:uncharacterized membrane protein YqjE
VTFRQPGNTVQQAILLTVIIAAGWVVCFWPARMVRDDSGVFWMTVAAGICLLPGWVVVVVSGFAILSNDLVLMLVQTMVRLMSVSVAAIVVKTIEPSVGFTEFYGWLVGFYLLGLLAEVWLMFRRPGAGHPIPGASASGASNSSE